MSAIYDLVQGGSPLILSIPHCGRGLTPGLAERLTPEGRSLVDTDWWLERLYDFGAALDATVLSARLSRYVIDLNRDPSGASLYPGQATTDLIPTTTFDGAPLYRPGHELMSTEVDERKRLYFMPYHDALGTEIARVKAKHGHVLLYDCHSIRSAIPRLFDGELPVLNLGTNSSTSCAPELQVEIVRTLQETTAFSHVVNGRFKGGWITRHYGRPADHVHAVQMELACRAYMQEEPPFAYDETKAPAIRMALLAILMRMLRWAASAKSA
ncbi:MAG: N-formylglutamate deformylase [Hyphomicrobiaceae bacterium]